MLWISVQTASTQCVWVCVYSFGKLRRLCAVFLLLLSRMHGIAYEWPKAQHLLFSFCVLFSFFASIFVVVVFTRNKPIRTYRMSHVFHITAFHVLTTHKHTTHEWWRQRELVCLCTCARSTISLSSEFLLRCVTTCICGCVCVYANGCFQRRQSHLRTSVLHQFNRMTESIYLFTIYRQRRSAHMFFNKFSSAPDHQPEFCWKTLSLCRLPSSAWFLITMFSAILTLLSSSSSSLWVCWVCVITVTRREHDKSIWTSHSCTNINFMLKLNLALVVVIHSSSSIRLSIRSYVCMCDVRSLLSLLIEIVPCLFVSVVIRFFRSFIRSFVDSWSSILLFSFSVIRFVSTFRIRSCLRHADFTKCQLSQDKDEWRDKWSKFHYLIWVIVHTHTQTHTLWFGISIERTNAARLNTCISVCSAYESLNQY